MQPRDPLSFDATALGHYIARQEQALYAQVVADVFGFHALQLGWDSYDLLEQSRIPYKHYLHGQARGPRTSLLCEAEFLPLADSSVDLVCLPHALEQCIQPQQSLREIFRIMVADGTLVLTGISPVSVLGMRARWGWFRQLGQFQRLFTAWRLRDWLGVLGFEVVQSGHFMHALPINDAIWLERQASLERLGSRSCGVTGGIYYIVAKKRVLNLRLIKPDWKKAPLTQALSVRKTHSKIQKQLECQHDNAAMDRDVR